MKIVTEPHTYTHTYNLAFYVRFKLLGPKKFNVPKICVPKQIYLPKHLWVHKVLGPKKFCMPKISGSQEKICLNKLDEEKILDLKILF